MYNHEAKVELARLIISAQRLRLASRVKCVSFRLVDIEEEEYPVIHEEYTLTHRDAAFLATREDPNEYHSIAYVVALLNSDAGDLAGSWAMAVMRKERKSKAQITSPKEN